jgi:hypothetical protein
MKSAAVLSVFICAPSVAKLILRYRPGAIFAIPRKSMSRTLPILLSAILLAGCTNHGAGISKSPVQPNPQPRLASDVHTRVGELSTMLDQFEVDLRELPGRTDADDRRAVAKLFGDLSEILPTVIGPNPNGSFQQQIRIIDETRARLIEGSPNLSAEPTEDTGLRAAYNALSSLQRDQFYDHQEIEKTVADLRVNLDSLDVVRGPLHRSTVKESLELIGKGARQMSEVLSARLANRT